MSSTILDLFIQDFVTSHKISNNRHSWKTLVSRWFAESSPATKVFQFSSGGSEHYAIGTLLGTPTGDVYRIEMTHCGRGNEEELRLDCLRMMSAETHTTIDIQKFVTSQKEEIAVISLTTRNRGLMNIAFVIRFTDKSLQTPFLWGCGNI